jgi:hypothetical protein
MKKLILTSIMSVAAASAFAQGVVNFLNDSGTLTSPPDRLVRFATGLTPGNVFGTNNAPLVGTNFQAQLYYGASTAPDSALVAVSSAPARFRASTTTLPGVWASGGLRTLSGFDFGSGQVKLQVRVWDIANGATYEAAALSGNGVLGTSQSFLYTMPATAGDPPGNFVMAGFTTFSATGGVIIPEPGTLALAGMGAAALLMFRRRK